MSSSRRRCRPYRCAAPRRCFPVRRVYCVGRNYAAHAIEMGHDPNKEPPFFFQKNPDNLILSGEAFPYPSKTSDVHFEIELVVALGKGGSDIPVEQALDHVYGYAVGLDMTRRDLQSEAKDLRPAVGTRQGVRVLRAVQRDRAGGRNRPSREGRDLARRQWRAQADRRPQPADLEGAGDDRLPVRPVHTRAGRPHHVRHALRASARSSRATSCTAMSTASATCTPR